MKTITITIEQDAEAGHIATAIYDAVRALGIGVTIDRGQHLESSQPTAMSPIVVHISEPQAKAIISLTKKAAE